MFDFRNSVIRATGDHGEQDYGIPNGPRPRGEFRLRNGVFREWAFTPKEIATLPSAERKKAMETLDWETTIVQDRILHRPGSSDVRVLVLNKSHLMGTGAFNYVFAFECKAGSVRKLFEASGEGVRLEETTANGIEISVGLWGDGDPHCCPSRVVHLHYNWSPTQHRFIRKESNAEAPWLP